MVPNLHRSHSWPPFKLPSVHSLHAPFTHHPRRSIDDDPFAFFISTNDGIGIDDEEAFINDYMSASIDTTPPTTRPRSLSPLKAQKRHGQTPTKEDRRAVLMLKKWVRRMEPKYFGRRSRSLESDILAPDVNERHRSPDLLPVPFEVSSSMGQLPKGFTSGFLAEPARDSDRILHHRGRQHLRKPARKDLGDNRQVRSHSGRPRIWRAPESDIWTVREEYEDPGLGISL